MAEHFVFLTCKHIAHQVLITAESSFGNLKQSEIQNKFWIFLSYYLTGFLDMLWCLALSYLKTLHLYIAPFLKVLLLCYTILFFLDTWYNSYWKIWNPSWANRSHSLYHIIVVLRGISRLLQVSKSWLFATCHENMHFMLKCWILYHCDLLELGCLFKYSKSNQNFLHAKSKLNYNMLTNVQTSWHIDLNLPLFGMEKWHFWRSESNNWSPSDTASNKSSWVCGRTGENHYGLMHANTSTWTQNDSLSPQD